MNFLFSEILLLTFSAMSWKFRGKITNTANTAYCQVTNLLANQFTLFLSRGFARAVVVVMNLEMALENLWQRGFDEWGRTPEISWVISFYELWMMKQER